MTEEYFNLLNDVTEVSVSNVKPVQQEDEFCMVIFQTIKSWAKDHKMDPVPVAEEILKLIKTSCQNDCKV